MTARGRLAHPASLGCLPAPDTLCDCHRDWNAHPCSAFSPVWAGDTLCPRVAFVLIRKQDRRGGPGRRRRSGRKHLLPAQTKHTSRSQECSTGLATV